MAGHAERSEQVSACQWTEHRHPPSKSSRTNIENYQKNHNIFCNHIFWQIKNKTISHNLVGVKNKTQPSVPICTHLYPSVTICTHLYPSVSIWVQMGTICTDGSIRWVQMGTDGYRWVQMGTDGYRWVQMGTDGYRWVQMGTDGYRWVQMGTDGYRWVLYPSVPICIHLHLYQPSHPRFLCNMKTLLFLQIEIKLTWCKFDDGIKHPLKCLFL